MTNSKTAFKVAASEARFGERFKMKSVTLNLLDVKISSKDTDGALAVFEQTGFTPQGGPPLHIHPHQDEMFYVIEGEYFFKVGDEEYHLKAGDSIFLPRNVPHAFVQLADKGRLIVMYQPAGKMEAFFKITDGWTAPPTKEAMIQAFADCDMIVVGTPLEMK